MTNIDYIFQNGKLYLSVESVNAVISDVNSRMSIRGNSEEIRHARRLVDRLFVEIFSTLKDAKNTALTHYIQTKLKENTEKLRKWM